MAEGIKNKILLIENSASDFVKARMPYCKHLISNGWNVYALVPRDDSLTSIDNLGINIIEFDFTRKNKSLIQILRLVRFFRKVIKENQINTIHSFRLEPNLINILANLFNKNKLIIHVTGLGIVFSKNSLKYKLLQLVSQDIYHLMLLRANVMVLQNDDDLKKIWFARFYKKAKVIYGSGVDTKYFSNELFNKDLLREKHGISKEQKVFIIITRLIWEKGIKELAEAFMSKELKNLNLKLLIVGWADKDNPQHVDQEYIDSFHDVGQISFLGKIEDVRNVLSLSDVFIYPSYYREGIPRGILEALSMGLPIITSNTPGCNLTVENKKNGFLIKPNSSKAIQESIFKILKTKNLKSMGDESRNIAKEKFSNEIIYPQFENLYSI